MSLGNVIKWAFISFHWYSRMSCHCFY